MLAGIGDFKLEAEELNTDFIVACFPNPATNTLFVKVSGTNDQKVEFKLINMVGQIMFLNKFSGDGLQEINVQEFSRGVYILFVSISTETKTIKIILD